MTDVVEGIKAYLLQDPGLQALPLAATAMPGPGGQVGPIYDEELDLGEDINMPAKVIVLMRGGGPGGPATIQYSTPRVNVRCYGETPHLAMVVFEALKLALKQMPTGIHASTYFHHGCRLLTDAIPFRDPDMQWPYNVSSWQTMTADLTVA